MRKLCHGTERIILSNLWQNSRKTERCKTYRRSAFLFVKDQEQKKRSSVWFGSVWRRSERKLLKFKLFIFTLSQGGARNHLEINLLSCSCERDICFSIRYLTSLRGGSGSKPRRCQRARSNHVANVAIERHVAGEPRLLQHLKIAPRSLFPLISCNLIEACCWNISRLTENKPQSTAAD